MPSPKGQSKPRKINVQRQLFAEHYALTGNVTESYMRAYPNVTDRATASAAGSRLLKDGKVLAYVQEIRDKAREKVELTVAWLEASLTTLYTRAMEAEDFNAAGQALNMIAKRLGAFELHNKQKTQYTHEDVERLRTELREKGFDLERYNDRSEN